MRRALALLLVAAASSCSKPAPQAEAQRKTKSSLQRIDMQTPDDGPERASVLTIARGAAVVSRTGEALLDMSAVRAIDSDPVSSWMCPPGDLPQSLTVALPARTRIDRVGVRTDSAFPTNHVAFERSVDGIHFVPLSTVAAQQTIDAQWFDVAPAEATQVRVTMVDRVAPGRDTRLRSVLAHGSELEPPHPGDLAGCWAVNDTRARFERHGASLAGTIPMRNLPLELDGGFDGRAYRFNWVRGNDYGYALFAVTPDAHNFSAMEWHEEAVPLFYGESWFGEQRPCNDIAIAADTRERFLKRTGRLSLFGIRFRDDGTVDRVASAEMLAWLAAFAKQHPVQLVAHEFRRGSTAANLAFAQRELDSLRDELKRAGITSVTFVARGSDAPRQVPDNDTMRLMYSSVDVEIRR